MAFGYARSAWRRSREGRAENHAARLGKLPLATPRYLSWQRTRLVSEVSSVRFRDGAPVGEVSKWRSAVRIRSERSHEAAVVKEV